MAWTDDLLEGMEDAKQATVSTASPGDLTAIAAAAARLAGAQKQDGGPTQVDASKEATAPRQTNAALPHDLFFTVPPNCRPGQPVCVQGPHGPIRMPLPQGYQPGERCKVRFGPSEMHQVVVPEGSKPGDVVKFPGPNDDELEARVPLGKQPGDVFEVSPPVMMVQVPPGARVGDSVCFTAMDGSKRETKVPKGLQEGQYFPSLISLSSQKAEKVVELQHACPKEEPPLIDLI